MYDKASRAAVAAEMRGIVLFAADPVAPGESVKSILRRAHTELQRPPFWRVRAAWHGQAGRWVSGAVEDFRARKRAIDEKRSRRHEAAQRELARDLAHLDRLRAALAALDESFYREEIAALGGVADWVSHRYRRDNRGD